MTKPASRRISRTFVRSCWLGLITLPLLSCGGDPEPIGEDEVGRAQEALQPFKAELMRALTAGLSYGPETAIEVCQSEAPRIAARVGSGTVEMGRTSHRLRNPENAPRAWVEPLLAAYAQDPPEAEPRTVALPGSSFGYVEPIYVRSRCLKCHGTEIEPDLLARIQALYPEDEAIGFREGEFRGLFWVTMPIDDASDSSPER